MCLSNLHLETYHPAYLSIDFHYFVKLLECTSENSTTHYFNSFCHTLQETQPINGSQPIAIAIAINPTSRLN